MLVDESRLIEGSASDGIAPWPPSTTPPAYVPSLNPTKSSAKVPVVSPTSNNRSEMMLANRIRVSAASGTHRRRNPPFRKPLCESLCGKRVIKENNLVDFSAESDNRGDSSQRETLVNGHRDASAESLRRRDRIPIHI